MEFESRIQDLDLIDQLLRRLGYILCPSFLDKDVRSYGPTPANCQAIMFQKRNNIVEVYQASHDTGVFKTHRIKDPIKINYIGDEEGLNELVMVGIKHAEF